MKIVIDIPDNYNLDDIKNGSIACGQILGAVKNGIPYNPSGDLISREAMKEAIALLFEHGGYDSGLVMNTIENVPSVIPADK